VERRRGTVIVATAILIFRQHTEVQMTATRITVLRKISADVSDPLTLSDGLAVGHLQVVKMAVQRVAKTIGGLMLDADLPAPAILEFCIDDETTS